jgi:hypothetical protein
MLLIITTEEISADGQIEDRLLGTYRIPNAESITTTSVGNVPLFQPLVDSITEENVENSIRATKSWRDNLPVLGSEPPCYIIYASLPGKSFVIFVPGVNVFNKLTIESSEPLQQLALDKLKKVISVSWLCCY